EKKKRNGQECAPCQKGGHSPSLEKRKLRILQLRERGVVICGGVLLPSIVPIRGDNKTTL
ncbi:MAG: hypothetical protein J6S90_04165, partial [Lentisphaeria bacterium]|nr:hypothetical protein [Lentisphaeria bacterium]